MTVYAESSVNDHALDHVLNIVMVGDCQPYQDCPLSIIEWRQKWVLNLVTIMTG